MGFEVDNFCGCIKLRTGSLIIGYMYLFLQVCTIIMCCIVFANGASINYEYDSDKVKRDVVTGILITFSILFIFEIFCVLNTISLLVGVHKNICHFVEPYLRFTASFLIIVFMTVIIKAACGSTTLQCLIFELCYAALTTYFFIVIKSHHHRMKDEGKMISSIF